jgi:hypothetical protein
LIREVEKIKLRFRKIKQRNNLAKRRNNLLKLEKKKMRFNMKKLILCIMLFLPCILTAQGLVDPAKIHAVKLKWIESEDGIIPTDAEQTTLDRVLVEATVSTVEDEEGVLLTGGTAGLLTPEEKFKLQ